MLNTVTVKTLLQQLKSTIEDDFRAYDDDDCPGILVTVSTNDGETWNFQTGSLEFIGPCYWDKYLYSVPIYRDSDCQSLAKEIVHNLRQQIE